MCTALVSALTQIPVRADVAMTGEITLRGQVLAIGGLKEKLLAAHRGGIKTVIIPEENQRDLKEIPENIKQDLQIKPVKWIDEVLQIALQYAPEPLPDAAPRLLQRTTSASLIPRSESARISLKATLTHFRCPCLIGLLCQSHLAPLCLHPKIKDTTQQK